MVEFKAGDLVVHAWAFEERRPRGLTEARINMYGFARIGTIVGLDDNIPSDADHRYWLVDIGGEVAQWREDLISLVS